jgi:hypothetical protein
MAEIRNGINYKMPSWKCGKLDFIVMIIGHNMHDLLY